MPGPYAIAVVGILRFAVAKIRNVLLTMYAAAYLSRIDSSGLES